MSKNSKKTMNERNHNSFGIYKSPNDPNEEFAKDFNPESKPEDYETNKDKNQQTKRNK